MAEFEQLAEQYGLSAQDVQGIAEAIKAQEPSEDKDKIIQRLQRDRDKAREEKEGALEQGRTQAKAEFEREQQALKVGGGLGLKPGAVQRFLKDNPEAEVTAETFKPWAEEFGIPIETEGKTVEPTKPEAPAQKVADLQAGGGGVAPGREMHTAKEVQRIGQNNEAEALRIIGEGLMETTLEGVGTVRPSPDGRGVEIELEHG